MPVPETQLATWSNQGATVSAQDTHTSIRLALNNAPTLQQKTFDLYLQGSYRNSTNIRGDSDVDIVAELQSVYYSNLDKLTKTEQNTYKAVIGTTDYDWFNFRNDVIIALEERYGKLFINPANRCVKVKANSGRLPADVVVSLEYRVYTRFWSTSDNDYISGIRFWDRGSSQWIVNFPKLHYKNGAKKNSAERTNERYKPTIRMFKNIRKKLIENGMLTNGVAPSYFIECLLYNVPDEHFRGSFEFRCSSIIGWLVKQFSSQKASQFICQNEQDSLFGSGIHQWDYLQACDFVIKLAEFWMYY